MKTTSAKELREMSTDQRAQLLKETTKKLFDLRVQAKMERLDSPSEVAKARKLIARIKTIQWETVLDTVVEDMNKAVEE